MRSSRSEDELPSLQVDEYPAAVVEGQDEGEEEGVVEEPSVVDPSSFLYGVAVASLGSGLLAFAVGRKIMMDRRIDMARVAAEAEDEAREAMQEVLEATEELEALKDPGISTANMPTGFVVFNLFRELRNRGKVSAAEAKATQAMIKAEVTELVAKKTATLTEDRTTTLQPLPLLPNKILDREGDKKAQVDKEETPASLSTDIEDGIAPSEEEQVEAEKEEEEAEKEEEEKPAGEAEDEAAPSFDEEEEEATTTTMTPGVEEATESLTKSSPP